MDSKIRAFIRGKAMDLQPLINIGKNGVTESVIEQTEDLLQARELIKINVLKNNDEDIKVIMQKLVEATVSEPIQIIGNKITLYRYSNKKGIEHIL